MGRFIFCYNYLSHELNSHPFIIGYIIIIIYLAIIIVFVGFHSKVDTQLSHSMWIKFFYLSTRYIKFIIKILSRYSYARWNDRVFSVLVFLFKLYIISFISFNQYLYHYAYIFGLRGKVPNRSLRGNKIILSREISSLGFEEMCDEIKLKWVQYEWKFTLIT